MKWHCGKRYSLNKAVKLETVTYCLEGFKKLKHRLVKCIELEKTSMKNKIKFPRKKIVFVLFSSTAIERVNGSTRAQKTCKYVVVVINSKVFVNVLQNLVCLNAT